MFRRLVFAAAAIAMLAMLSAGPARAVLQIGDVAPDFHKTDLNGTAQTLSQYRGKVVFLFLLGFD
jgi:hypothetical protein